MTNVQCSVEQPCTAVQLLTQRATNHEERMDKMDKMLESMQNRLPLWATLTLTAAGGTIGILAGHVRF